jgi:hypothetical protein
MPNTAIDFPYGLAQSPAESQSLRSYFEQDLTVLCGTRDNDPNANSLRRNSRADVQGDDRLERAQYFYQESVQIAQNQNLSINWQYKTLTNVGHDFEANALYAMDLLY